MTTRSLKQIQKEIRRIKAELLTIDSMRPGSLSKQYNVCGSKGCQCKDPKDPKKHGPYYQLSYSHNKKSTSQFIRPQFVEQTRQQTANYKRFKELTEQWVSLAIEEAKIKMSQG